MKKILFVVFMMLFLVSCYNDNKPLVSDNVVLETQTIPSWQADTSALKGVLIGTGCSCNLGMKTGSVTKEQWKKWKICVDEKLTNEGFKIKMSEIDKEK